MKSDIEIKTPRQRTQKEIAVAEIDRDPDNRNIDDKDERFLALVDSVRVFGVPQRIHVGVQGDRLQIIDGERRYRAALAAGLESIPCEVWPAKANRADVIAAGIILNDQRQAHSSIQIARRLRDLKISEGLTGEQVAERMAMPLDRVKTYFTLFGASDFLVQVLSEHTVPLKVAAELVRYERATSESRIRPLLERYLVAPLTREQLVQLRKRATETKSAEPHKGSYDEGKNRTAAFSRAIERAYRRDAQTALAAIEETLKPFGYVLVAIGSDEPAEFPEQ